MSWECGSPHAAGSGVCASPSAHSFSSWGSSGLAGSSAVFASPNSASDVAGTPGRAGGGGDAPASDGERAVRWDGWGSPVSGGDGAASDAAYSAPEFGGSPRLRLRTRIGRLPAGAAATAHAARRRWRKQVTGDHDRRIREFLRDASHDALERHVRRARMMHERGIRLKEEVLDSRVRRVRERGIQLKEEVLDARVRRAQEEWQAKVSSKPHVMRVLDRLSFTGGVLGIVVSEYVLLQLPHLFWALYSVVMPSLLVMRFFIYRAAKYQYFMLDFCYYVQLLVCLQIVWPNETLFRLCFAFANGPLGWAIVAWRNSLVFHSFDKVTSVYIHVFPMLLTYCWRWRSDDERGRCVGRSWWRWGCDGDDFDSYNVLAVPLVAYTIWQVFYLIVTEAVGPPSRDESLTTSLRFLAATGEKSATVKVVKKVLIRLGLMRPDDTFSAGDLRTKCTLITFQLLYTIATLLPTWIIFRSEGAHLVFMLFCMAQSVWNGAAYYFEVFASSYPHARARKPPKPAVGTPQPAAGGARRGSGGSAPARRSTPPRRRSSGHAQPPGSCSPPQQQPEQQLRRRRGTSDTSSPLVGEEAG